jgi:uncharacterized membrane protein
MRLQACVMMSLSVLALAVGCGDDAEDEEHALPDVDCEGADVPAFDEVAAFDKCTVCHSSELSGEDRMDAPEDDNWDDYEEAAEHAEEIAHEVFEGEMPPEDSGITLTAAEEEDLYLWALCGTPE